MSLQPGQPAPQFTLYSSALKEVSLADFKGKKVVIHWPKRGDIRYIS
jgi:peroxiredoxin